MEYQKETVVQCLFFHKLRSPVLQAFHVSNGPGSGVFSDRGCSTEISTSEVVSPFLVHSQLIRLCTTTNLMWDAAESFLR